MADLSHWVSDNLYNILGYREKAVEGYIIGIGEHIKIVVSKLTQV